MSWRKTGCWGSAKRDTRASCLQWRSSCAPPAPTTPADGLLYVSAAPYYAAYAGGAGARAAAAAARSTRAAGTPRAGRSAASPRPAAAVVGVLAAFPADDGEALARRFVAPDARALAAVARPGADPPPARDRRRLAAPAARDALRRRARHRSGAPAPRRRRARCWREAERLAAEAGLAGVALDTGIENRAARALYERSGFAPRGLRPAPDERTARAVGGSGFVGYVKPR